MFKNLLAEMARKGLSINTLAKKIGISGKTLGIKLKGEREFTRREMMKIKHVFNDRYTLEYLFDDFEDEKSA